MSLAARQQFVCLVVNSLKQKWTLHTLLATKNKPSSFSVKRALHHDQNSKAIPKTSSRAEHSTSSLQKVDHLNPWQWEDDFQLPEPELDWSFLLDKKNTEAIKSNIQNRKGIGDIDKVLLLSDKYDQEKDGTRKEELRKELLAEALDIPNMSHHNAIVGDESQAEAIEYVGNEKVFESKPRSVSEIGGKALKMLREENLTFATGSKTYFLQDGLARLERALVSFTLDQLTDRGFEVVSVPDLLHAGVIDSCGFKTSSERSQVYRLHPDCLQGACLAGTSEMSLAGYFMNEVVEAKELPKKLAAVSRCYRAEAAEKAVERGLYRVHHFTKVEMFGLTACEVGSESRDLLHEFLAIERDLFSKLGLYFKILDMPTEELGAPAHQKYDIEAYMYGKGIWGEISSCSNCTDYQARRLNIKYPSSCGRLKHVHTVNGTACAVPRMIISLLEQHQQKKHVNIPEVLWPYMNGQTTLTADFRPASSTYIKTLRRV